jgi:hypothetical protein
LAANRAAQKGALQRRKMRALAAADEVRQEE